MFLKASFQKKQKPTDYEMTYLYVYSEFISLIADSLTNSLFIWIFPLNPRDMIPVGLSAGAWGCTWCLCTHSDAHRNSLPKDSTSRLDPRRNIFQGAAKIRKNSGSKSYFTSLKCMLFIPEEFIENTLHLSLF